MNTKHMEQLSGDKQTDSALSETPFQQRAQPDCKRIQWKKRNTTQSSQSLSRLWLIHSWKSAMLTKKLLRGRINREQGCVCSAPQAQNWQTEAMETLQTVYRAAFNKSWILERLNVAVRPVPAPRPALSLLSNICSVINRFDVVYFPVFSFNLSLTSHYSVLVKADIKAAELVSSRCASC